MDSFPCTQCGQCCRHVGPLLEDKDNLLDPLRKALVDSFPYQARDDGSCEMLDKDGLCSVYDDRPMLCNIYLMAKAQNKDLTDYYLTSAQLCNKMIINAGLPAEYLINLEQIRKKTH